MTPEKLATVRFYFDADVLGLAKVIANLREDCTYPGDPGAIIRKRRRPPCPVIPGAKDPQWIPLVAERQWLIITRDRHIQQKRAEIAAVQQSGAKMVNLASDDAASVWGQLEVVMTRWRQLERLAEDSGPFIIIASRSGKLRKLQLPSSS